MVNILKKTKKIPKRSFSQKIKVLALGIIVVFITLEIALRFAGLVFFRMQEYRNRVSLRNKSSYRIVCLGESTTAMGGVNSYPTQLEEILNQRSIGVKFSVLNLGIPASNTAAILGELEDNLRSYNPDMVISMMGANDKGEYVPYKEGLAGNKVNLTKVFKTYKLARFLWFYVVSKNSAGKSANNADIADVINQDQPATRKEVEAAARKLYGEASPGLYFLNLANDYFIQKRYGEAAECYKKVIGLGFQDRIVKISSHGGVYYSLGECYEKLGRYKDAEVAYQKLIKERPDLGYAKLEKVYEQEGQVQLAKEYSEKAKAFRGCPARS